MFPGHGVRVWQARIDRLAPHIQEFEPFLHPDEQARAGRCRSSRHRAEFVIRRGLLRVILGHCLGVEPGALQFEYGPQGRPAIARPACGRSLHFSLSHSYGAALYAVVWGRAVGVDLERVRLLSEAEQIADQFFSARESRALRELPGSEKVQGFFNCWTRKEAYLKATGQGLAHGLDDFSVSLAPGEPARLLEVQANPAEIARWSFHELLPTPGYAAALCVQAS
jgi:4'-phosphopantetheinyl transferase